MSATNVIAEIKRLPKREQARVFRFVVGELQTEEDRLDNAAADLALKRGDFIPWTEAKKSLRRPGATKFASNAAC